MYNRVLYWLEKNNAIEKEDYEVYRYCLEYILESMAYIFSVIALGMIVKELTYSLLFVLVFMLIRSYAGGYHSKSSFRCYLLSMGCFAGSFIIKRLLEEHLSCSNLTLAGVLLAAVVLISVLSPVESINKPLTPKQKINNKIITAIILICVYAGSVIYSVLKAPAYGMAIIMYIILFSQIAGIISYRKDVKQHF